MLVDHQIKRPVFSGKQKRMKNRCPRPASADDTDAIDLRLRLGSVEVICEPDDVMPAPRQLSHVLERDALGSTSQRVFRVTPVEHQKTQRLHTAALPNSATITAFA